MLGDPSGDDHDAYAFSAMYRWRTRDDCVAKYSWAVPNQQAVVCLRDHSPVLELGAGTGYWASLVGQAGGYVRCYDKNPAGTWWPVLKGRARKARKFSDHTLFLCWPPYQCSLAYDALTAYTGDTFIYVGEGWGGCTGDDRFHELLETNWSETRTVFIPQWFGIHDRMVVFCRK